MADFDRSVNVKVKKFPITLSFKTKSGKHMLVKAIKTEEKMPDPIQLNVSYQELVKLLKDVTHKQHAWQSIEDMELKDCTPYLCVNDARPQRICVGMYCEIDDRFYGRDDAHSFALAVTHAIEIPEFMDNQEEDDED